MAYAWITPDAAMGAYTCRRLSIPVELVHAVTGALELMAQVENWETLGSMTPDEAALLCETMLDNYLVSDGACMIGSVSAFAGVLPTGVLACDGSQYLRVDYPLLYAMLDASLIVDADNFTTPDLQGRTVLGSGSGAGLTARSFGDTGGKETHQLTTSEIPSHDHGVHQHGVSPDIEGVGVPDLAAAPGIPGGLTGSRGGGGSHENMPPFSVLNYGIVAR